MQIILLEQVKNLGTVGEVVVVKDGFARNYLLPNQKALRATKANIDYFETQKATINKQNDEAVKVAKAVAKKADAVVVTVLQQAGEDGRLYGSVTITDIANAVSEASGEKIERKLVALHDPIKYIGIHTVEIDLHAEVVIHVSVNVARTADEAKASAAKFGRGETVMEGPGADVTISTDVANDYDEVEAVAEAASEEEAESDDAQTEEATDESAA